MVKVTVEHDGKVTTHEGELFFGCAVTRKSVDVTKMEVMVRGRGNQHNFPKDIGNMAVDILTKTAENQIDANGMMLELYYFLDKKIEEHMKENADALIGDIASLLKEEKTDDENH